MLLRGSMAFRDMMDCRCDLLRRVELNIGLSSMPGASTGLQPLPRMDLVQAGSTFLPFFKARRRVQPHICMSEPAGSCTWRAVWGKSLIDRACTTCS